MPTNLMLLAAALTAPLFELEPRGARLEVGEQGQIAVYRKGEPLLSDARLALWNTAWKGTDQRAAEVLEVRRLAGAMELASRLQLDGVAWNIIQRVAPEGDGVRLSYELRPAAATEVNEVSLMLDLPVDRYRGRRLLLLPATETTFPAEPPASKHFVMAAASRYVFAAGEENQISLTLDEPHLLNVQDTRLMQGSVYQPFVKIIPERTAVKPGEVFTLSLLLTPRDPAVYRLPRLALSDNRPLALGAVTISERPQAGRRVDLKVELAGRWRTPYWAEEVALDAVIEGAGRSWRVPGFYTRDYRRQVVGGNELLEPAGDGRWEVRFLPPEPGEYRVKLTARDASGEYRVKLTARDASGEVSTTTSFTAAAGTRRPYLRVSTADPHYFEFDDGRPYFANGLNVCWYKQAAGTTSYDSWFASLAEQGGNYARIWMPEWAFGYEWGKPGEYRLERAQQFDYVLDLAAERGIYLKLCLENFRTFGAQNPYAKANGGPCDTVMEVFTHPEARRMWQNRLRYAVARWGWSPNLMAWEFWNEIDCVQGYQAPAVQAWTADMARWLRDLDPFDHLVVNSLGSFVFEPELWRSPAMDFAQMHGYWHPTWRSREFGKDMAAMMASHVAMLRQFGKPALFAEFGLVNESWGLSPRGDDDRDGVNLHNGLWGAMMAGAAGTGHLWWWDNYVAPKNLWYHFRGVASFVESVPWTSQGFTPYEPAASPAELRVMGLRGRTQTLLWAQNRAHTWWRVAERQPVPAVTQAQITLPEVRGAVTVERWDPYTGQKLASEPLTAGPNGLVIELGEVARDVALKVLSGR